MSCKPDQWAKDWLDKQREEGKTGLTIEKKGNLHYLKWATTIWDPETKKRRKISEYRGVLRLDGIVEPPKSKRDTELALDEIRDSGNAELLAEASEHFFSALKQTFPKDHHNIIELAFARCMGKGELSKAGRCWNGMENVLGLRPDTSPELLSASLNRIGGSEIYRDIFFERIETHEEEMAIDLSLLFSKTKGATLLKHGFDRFDVDRSQLNILLICGMASGRPQSMKILSFNKIDEMFDIPKRTMLVLGRRYCRTEFLKDVRKRGLHFLVAAKRTSKAYDTVIAVEGMFRWKGSAVSYGHARYGDIWAYRFEDFGIRNDELIDALKAKEKGSKREPDLDRAGSLILLVSKEMDPVKVYTMYRNRLETEEFFRSANDVLSADKVYIDDDAQIIGYLFVTFVSLLISSFIENIIAKAGMSDIISMSDLLEIYGTVRSVTSAGCEIKQPIPDSVRKLDEKLGLKLFADR